MSIQTIIDRINQEATEAAKEKLETARKHIGERLMRAKRERSKQLKQMREQAEKEREIERNIRISEARREARRTVLEAKEEVISECFQIAKKKLSKLSETRYEQFLERMLDAALEKLDGECVAHLTREEDREWFASASRRVSVASALIDGRGGFILEGAKGRMRIDATFDGILTRDHTAIRAEVAKILFADLDLATDEEGDATTPKPDPGSEVTSGAESDSKSDPKSKIEPQTGAESESLPSGDAA